MTYDPLSYCQLQNEYDIVGVLVVASECSRFQDPPICHDTCFRDKTTTVNKCYIYKSYIQYPN